MFLSLILFLLSLLLRMLLAANKKVDKLLRGICSRRCRLLELLSHLLLVMINKVGRWLTLFLLPLTLLDLELLLLVRDESGAFFPDETLEDLQALVDFFHAAASWLLLLMLICIRVGTVLS